MKYCSEEGASNKPRILRSIRKMVAEVQNTGVRLLNCLECMRITSDFMEIAPSVRSILIAQIDECLFSDILSLNKALEMSVGYSQGVCQMLRHAAEESLWMPCARAYFLLLIRKIEEKAIFLKKAKYLWGSLNKTVEVLFVLPMLLFVFTALYMGNLFPKIVQFFIHLSVAFFLSISKVRLFESSKRLDLFSSSFNQGVHSVDALIVKHEGASLLYIYLAEKEFCEEERFLSFMSTFFHGKVVVHQCPNEPIGRKSFRIHFRKPRLSYLFVQDILHIVTGFFYAFSRETLKHNS